MGMTGRLETKKAGAFRKLSNAGLRCAGYLAEANLRSCYAALEQAPFTLSGEDREQLRLADVISFDVFDTLIVRDFSDKRVIFDLCGTALHFQGFRSARVEAERSARAAKQEEVTLEEIYAVLEKDYGIDPAGGMELERLLELAHCAPYPRMRRLYEAVLSMCRKTGKQCVITSDMYMPEEQISRMLARCGYDSWDALFVSSTSGKKKADGGLFRLVKEQMGADKRFVHIGDNARSDVEMARAAGFYAIRCPDIHQAGLTAGRLQVNTVSGSLYCGLVNRLLPGGAAKRGLDDPYCQGYVYFGLVVYGFCRWLHAVRKLYDADTIWFAARDMKVVREVYRRLFPGETVEYVAASRLAMLKANQPRMSAMFLQNLEAAFAGGSSCGDALSRMRLPEAAALLEECGVDLADASERMKEKALETLRERRGELAARMQPEKEAAGAYLGSLQAGERILFVDLNGRCTSAMAARDLLEELGRPCDVICAQLYTTTAGELFDARASREDVLAWLFSTQHERYHRNVFSYHWDRYASVLETVFTEARGTLLSYRRGEDGELTYAEYVERSADPHAERHTDRHTDRGAERHTDRNAGRHADRSADREAPAGAGGGLYSRARSLERLHDGILAFAEDFDRVWSGIARTGQVDRELAWTVLMAALQDERFRERVSLEMGN